MFRWYSTMKHNESHLIYYSKLIFIQTRQRLMTLVISSPFTVSGLGLL